ncbi:MAG: hypothetical protein HQ593_04950 [Candidatus Omnitrophica bacterium]|nr:hypothetical protein [Candidatus Omnitrophota bacterium]
MKNFTAIVVVCSILAISPILWAQEDPLVHKYNEEGLDALKDNEFGRAIWYFNKALDLAPSNHTIRENLAVSYNNCGLQMEKKGELDKGINYLKDALRIKPGDEHIERNLANLYNTKAIKLSKEGEWDKAEDIFERILNLFPSEIDYKKNFSSILLGKAASTYKKKDLHKAKRDAEKSLRYNPLNSDAMVLMGDINYDLQRLKEAHSWWEKAMEIDSSSSAIEQRLAKVKREYQAEVNLEKLPAEFFEIRFEKELEGYSAYAMRDILRSVRRTIGQDFNYFPSYKTIVLVYPEETFRELTNTPPWISGLYDGKIRLPFMRRLVDKEELERIIRHEYTHVLVHSLAEGNCPVWLNEGLAQHEEYKDQEPDLKRLEAALKSNTHIPISALQINLSKTTDKDRVTLFYQESYLIVDYIIDRWRLSTIRSILTRLKRKEAIEMIFKKELYMTMEEFETRWLEYARKRFR